MLKVPKAPIRVKDVHPFESESVLMLNKDANKSLFSEKIQSRIGNNGLFSNFFLSQIR